MVTNLWRKFTHPVFILCAGRLAFYNGWKDRNLDYCVNTAVDPCMFGKNIVNFGSITFESYSSGLCMGG